MAADQGEATDLCQRTLSGIFIRNDECLLVDSAIC